MLFSSGMRCFKMSWFKQNPYTKCLVRWLLLLGRLTFGLMQWVFIITLTGTTSFPSMLELGLLVLNFLVISVTAEFFKYTFIRSKDVSLGVLFDPRGAIAPTVLNLAISKFVLATPMIIWGIVSMALSGVTEHWSFYVIDFLVFSYLFLRYALREMLLIPFFIHYPRYSLFEAVVESVYVSKGLIWDLLSLKLKTWSQYLLGLLLIGIGVFPLGGRATEKEVQECLSYL